MATKRKATKRAKEHPCFAQVDKELAKQGDCLQRVVSLSGRPRTVYVAIERKDTVNWKRGSTWLAVNYCPFCGKKVER